jgi:conjugative relaxase-like TrwC/TraI family protein
MVATIAAGTSAEYYIATTEYYLGGHEPAGRWILAAEGLSLIAGTIVERSPFEHVHAGLRPDGAALLSTVGVGGPKRRIGGYDATFSAPKSLALLWALADDELRAKLDAAQAEAVAEAIALAQDYAAFCRYGRNGVHRSKTYLTIAAFRHGESRPARHSDGQIFADPNLHTHCVIINAGPRLEQDDDQGQEPAFSSEKFGALDGAALFAWKMAMGAQYHASLAFALQRLGLQLSVTGKNGLFEIDGLPADLIQYFSARRNEIAEELAAIGIESVNAPAIAAAVARSSRKVKQQDRADDRHADWRERVFERGHDPADVVAVSLKQPDHSVSLTERLLQIPRVLTEHESTFERRHLHAAVASAYVGTGEDPRQVATHVERLISDGQFVVLGLDRFGQEILTTPEMMRLESEIGQMVRALSAATSPAPETARVNELIALHGLNEDQAAAARASLSAQAISLIEGAPGSGKTTMLAAVTGGLQERGYRVIGGATAWKVANAMRNELGVEARAIDSWIALAGAGGEFISPGTALVIDEAGLLSSRQMHSLLKAFGSGQAHGSRLILVGDRNQLQSVGAGSGLGLVANAMAGSRVNEIVRQHDRWARDAVTDFGKGRAREALLAFRDRGLVLEGDGAAATVKVLVDAWEEASVGSKNDQVLLIAKTNAQVRAISAEVRRRLRDQGRVTGPDLPLLAVNASGQEVNLALAQGDSVRFLTRATIDSGQIVNGTEGRIEAIHRGSRVELTVATRDGLLRFSPDEIADDKGRVQIAHAYASTIYLAQGMTVDRAIVWLTPGMDRHDIYVASSRSRVRTQFVIDRKALETSLKSSLPLNERRVAETTDADTNLNYLAAQLSRARIKHTTQDFAPLERTPGAVSPTLQETPQVPLRRHAQRKEMGLD